MLWRYPTKDHPSDAELLHAMGREGAVLLREGGLEKALLFAETSSREVLFTLEQERDTVVYSLREFVPYGKLLLPRPIYIFCEGAVTEANYFGGFQRQIEREPIYQGMLTIAPCASNTTQIVREARRYVKKHQITKGEIWCVYDKDDFPADRFDRAVTLARELSKESSTLQYHTAWSNESFEFWFVLHFADYRSNNHREQYVRFLKDRLGSYKKNRPDLFEVMTEQGSPRLAIRYAKRILEESAGKRPSQIAPGTTVHLLVEQLIPYLPEELQGRFR